MSKLRFGAPLYLYLDQSRPDLGMAPVADIDEGLHVMQRGPIARYRFAGRGGEREAWSTALYALTRAKFHPRGDKTEEARSALRRLAFAAGALVTITRGRTFSPERGGRASSNPAEGLGIVRGRGRFPREDRHGSQV